MRKSLALVAALATLSGTGAFAMDGNDHDIFKKQEMHAKKHFGMMDADKDGMVSKKEYTMAMDAKFAKADMNGDGMMDEGEMMKMMMERIDK